MKSMDIFLLIALACLGRLLTDCSNKDTFSDAERPAVTKEHSLARAIIFKSIEAHGGDLYKKHEIKFDFRNRTYLSKRTNGIYAYHRIFTDTSGRQIEDILTNDSFTRRVDGEAVELHDTIKNAYSSSVNSVIYFALLPYFLNDPAVNSSYLGKSRVKGEFYEKIKVTFTQEGGGEDFEDEYIYWFNSNDNTLQYLAYNYLTDGGGARFREAFNPRVINGIRFVDYVNYKPNPETRYIMNFDTLFEAGKLEKLSVIALENISVNTE